MEQSSNTHLRGKSGKSYWFKETTSAAELPEHAGVYVFLTVNPMLRILDVHYVGQAENIRRRFGEHSQTGEKWERASAFGANRVSFLLEPLLSERLRVEEDLIQQLAPPLNVKHNPVVNALLSSSNSKPANSLAGLIVGRPQAEETHVNRLAEMLRKHQ